MNALSPAIRQRVETTIDQLITILDAADAPHMDLEPDNDDKGVDDDGELAADDVGEATEDDLGENVCEDFSRSPHYHKTALYKKQMEYHGRVRSQRHPLADAIDQRLG